MRILYFALGQMTTASSRLRVYKIAEQLRLSGNHVDIKISYADVVDYDLVVVQKRQDFYREMDRWIGGGVPVVFDIDDPADRLPPHTILTVGSVELQKRHLGSVYVPDCLDITNGCTFKDKHNIKLNKVCWFGLACNLYNAEPVYSACCKLGLELVIVTDLYGSHKYPRWKHGTYIEWGLDTVDEVITHCDLVVCPYVFDGCWDKSWIQAKGENRILKAWGLGMPVAGTSIPSYFEHGLEHCATTEEEWIKILCLLMDKDLRVADAEKGLLKCRNRLASDVAKRWERVFESCLVKG